MAGFRLRWSEHEAGKPYARPFMVTFHAGGKDDVVIGSVALNGADLLYQRHFVIAVAALGGELFALDVVEQATDPQRSWLDVLTPLLPARAVGTIAPRSTFSGDRGRVFAFAVQCEGCPDAVVDAATLFAYQDLQAAVAHQTGGLLRVPEVEALDDPGDQRLAWTSWLRIHLERPTAADAMNPSWPWR